jgi:hypothetical protein
VLALPALMQASPVNSVMQQTSMLESRMMVRKGSAMTKKAEGETGREVLVVRRMKTREEKMLPAKAVMMVGPHFLSLVIFVRRLAWYATNATVRSIIVPVTAKDM